MLFSQNHQQCLKLLRSTYLLATIRSKNLGEHTLGMFESIGKKINLLMSKAGISGMQLARELGIPASTIKKIRSKEITNPTVATLVPIARYFSVTIEYLLESGEESEISEHPSKQYIDLPLISWEEAAQLKNTDQGFALLIVSNNEAIFPLGSLIIIEPSTQIEHNDFVIIVENTQQKAMLRRFIYREGIGYLCSIDDVSVNSIVPFTAEYRLLGVVVEYKKRFKNIKTEPAKHS